MKRDKEGNYIPEAGEKIIGEGVDKTTIEMNDCGWNIKELVLEVKHSELKRFSEDSKYKSYCPKCNKGVLLVRRNKDTFNLEEDDNCILCGQRYRYTDIKDIKDMV